MAPAEIVCGGETTWVTAEDGPVVVGGLSVTSNVRKTRAVVQEGVIVTGGVVNVTGEPAGQGSEVGRQDEIVVKNNAIVGILS